MRRVKSQGLTLVEMLIVMAILGIVLLVTSSGIIQALNVNRVAEDATNVQSKLRRVTEVISQELRAAVFGGMMNYPEVTGPASVSFALLSGDGGLPVVSDPSGNEASDVFVSDGSALTAMVGRPAVMLNNSGDAVVIPTVTSAVGNTQLRHSGCPIGIDYDTNTRMFAATTLGFRYSPENETLYHSTVVNGNLVTVPFAFGLSRFDIQYEFSNVNGTVVRSSPPTNSFGEPQPVLLQGGERYDLSRLRLTLASAEADGSSSREYVGYIELTGLGNELFDPLAEGTGRAASSITVCDNWVAGPDPEPEPDPDPDPTPDPDPDPTPDPEPEPDPCNQWWGCK